MPSIALSDTLEQMLLDAEALNFAYTRLVALPATLQKELDAMIRGMIVACVSAWEAYVEAIVLESVEAMRPAGPTLGGWSSHKALVVGEVKRFNTPNPESVKLLLSNTLGLIDIQQEWVWPGYTAAHAIQDLTIAMKLRNQIAHGVSPRP